MKEVSFDDVVLTHGKLRVSIEWIGEGWSGDYNPEDPKDDPLVRFYCWRKDGDRWEEIENASYCTRTPATLPRKVYAWMARKIMAVLEDALESGNVKRRMQEMSWVGIEDYEKSKKKK